MRALPALLAALAVASVQAHGGGEARAPAFELPAVGSYRLPPIQPAPAGAVLDQHGKRRDLAELTRGRITLLSFVYTRCADAEGCPRATWAFGEVRRRVAADAALRSKVRLVTLSFDPAHDVPAVMAAYARRVGAARPGPAWTFLTTESRRALDPILEGFGQDLRVAADSSAVPGTEEFAHTLKAFLIDRRGRVREIYSGAYLMPEMIENDIRTLAAEAQDS